MATTFQVFFLGNIPDLDPTEGDGDAENAAGIVGTTFGGVGDPLLDHVQTLSPGSSSYTGGASSTGYDTDNNWYNETFRINGGPDQTVDTAIVYNATVTYTDGTSATITAVVFQDTGGNFYLAPELSANADQSALEAKPIRSLTLDSLNDNTIVLSGERYNGTYATCFTSGTAIRTPSGDVLIENLKVGDPVTTMDNGPQPIRWIGTQPLSHAQLQARPNMRPILIRKGLLGATRNLLVSPQHGMLLGRDGLVRAKHLVDLPKSGVRIAHGKKSVTYIHLMFDAHQIIFAENAASESFYPGPMAMNGLTFSAKAKLQMMFPSLIHDHAPRFQIEKDYGITARPIAGRAELRRRSDAITPHLFV